MDEPIKIIHKFKNTNKKIQYHIHIFIGNLVSNDVMEVLEKIKNLDLYATLSSLSLKERNLLENRYGKYWYESFFNMHHIAFIKDSILASNIKINEIKTMYGSEWFDDHIVNYKKRIQTTEYSYEATIKEERERRYIKKSLRKQEDDELSEIDFSVEQSSEMMRIDSDEYIQQCDDSDECDVRGNNSSQRGNNSSQQGNNLPLRGGTDQDIEDTEVSSEINVDDFFMSLNVAEKDIKKTTQEIKEAISSTKFSKLNNTIVDFDESNDTSMFDESLKQVFKKNYIVNQFIFNDDTIKTIKGKICCAFKNSNKYGDPTYIIPSYQYLWSEYIFSGKIEKIMIGQKWVVRNDILKIDVEPSNNISIYEELRGSLSALRDSIRRQSRIKYEDEDNFILSDYNGFYTYNEIYMIDIYNELGLEYEPSFEDLKNIMDVYLKIYFPHISSEDIPQIINYLSKTAKQETKTVEKNKLKIYHDNIRNNMIMENEITNIIEGTKQNKTKYANIFGNNHVIQSVVYTYLIPRNTKTDLRRIFDNFVVDDDFVFIQYRPMNGVPNVRFSKKFMMEYSDKNVIVKWFESSPFGISVRAKMIIKERIAYITINLNENGRLDYKIHWKEDDSLSVTDIPQTYPQITKMINKINNENKGFINVLRIPEHNDFHYAFMNTIQRFNLPEKYTINHNDLSEFARLFYPYVSLIIAPRKRESRIKKSTSESKFGTYLRYKRVKNYENMTRIENRIIFFIRNYEYNDQSLSAQISKEFNITEPEAMKVITTVIEQNPNIKKSRKVLKKLENIPKIRLPGIGIEIQGKERNKYKIRVDGARDKEQLDRILSFMNILIYLYIETYILKKTERQKLKDTLKKLSNIAKRKHKVEDINEEIVEAKSVKQIIALDKGRLGSSTSHERKNWTRDCQNSGDDKKRRPIGFVDEEELKQHGYVKVSMLDNYDFEHYERRVMVDDDGNVDSNKKKYEVVLKAAKLPKIDDEGSHVYWICGPEENGKHMFIGFLGKASDPKPCCFIKDHLYSANNKKRNAYLKSMGISNIQSSAPVKQDNEIVYILQDNNKLPVNRLAFLPKYLNILFNYLLNKTKKMKNQYLSSSDGYYFKYGVEQDNFRYLSSVGSVLKMTVDELKNKMINALENDKSLSLFTSLNNGDIRTRFTTVKNYIEYIKTNEHLSHKLLCDLLCSPGVITNNGLAILIFRKKIKITKKSLEKEKIKEVYDLVCNNNENVDDIIDPLKQVIYLIKAEGFFCPIVLAKKSIEQKQVTITSSFRFEKSDDNIVDHVYNYYRLGCKSEFSILIKDDSLGGLTAKRTQSILLSTNDKTLSPAYQFVDARNKCRYLITESNYIIPTLSSGAIHNIKIANSIDKFLSSWDKTTEYLIKANNKTNGQLKLKPIGIYYHDKDKNSYMVSSVMTENYNDVPISEMTMAKSFAKENKILAERKPHDSFIDNEIIKGKTNVIADQRIKEITKNKYINELYQLFRLHLSYYLNNIDEGIKYKDSLVEIINSSDSKNKKFYQIKGLLYEMTDKKLASTFKELIAKDGIIVNPKNNNWITSMPMKPIDYGSIKLLNNRELCTIKTKETCELNGICKATGNGCVLGVREDYLIDFINKATNELFQNGLNACEILKQGNCFISNVVNQNVFVERNDEMVVSGSSLVLNKIMSEIFGKERIPKIGKQTPFTQYDYDQLNIDNPLKHYEQWIYQNVVPNNITIFRAFANCLFWSLHPHNNTAYRNLGYYSNVQTDLANYYKSQVVDWLMSKKGHSIEQSVTQYASAMKIYDYAIKLSTDTSTFTECIIELVVLSKLYDIPIDVYNDNYKVIYAINPVDGVVYDSGRNIGTKKDNSNKSISIKFTYISNKTTPDIIESMYKR